MQDADGSKVLRKFGRFSLKAALGAAMLFGAVVGSAEAKAEAAPRDIRPALWSVSDSDTTVYLFGSIHVLRPHDKWRFPALREALSDARAVYFEAPTDILSQASLTLLVARLGFNPPERPLSEQVSPETWARLERLSRRYDVTADSLEAMRPWFAFLTLSAAATAKFGASAAHGVDAVMERDARRAGKEIRTFEDLEQQIRIFADLAPETEAAVLETALIELEKNPNQFDSLLEAWGRGDVASVEKLSIESLRSAPPVLLERLYTDRNNAWALELDTLLRKEQGAFLVVVGAAHLTGAESVQNLLKKKGYFVSRR